MEELPIVIITINNLMCAVLPLIVFPNKLVLLVHRVVLLLHHFLPRLPFLLGLLAIDTGYDSNYHDNEKDSSNR